MGELTIGLQALRIECFDGAAQRSVQIGAVVDFLSFHAGGWYWPAFNVADSAITLGAALVILDGLRKPTVSKG
ncbi:MAG: hypothetical protein EBY95_01320 [Actinobacteria bacterium]|nr:hypothetical protein [Actinomycetota bacterium]